MIKIDEYTGTVMVKMDQGGERRRQCIRRRKIRVSSPVGIVKY